MSLVSVVSLDRTDNAVGPIRLKWKRYTCPDIDLILLVLNLLANIGMVNKLADIAQVPTNVNRNGLFGAKIL